MKKYFGFVFLLVFAVSASLFVGCGKVDSKLNFVVDGEVYATISTNGEESIKLPANPEKEGYVFDGWYWDNEVWKKPFTANSLLDTPLSSDMSVYAKFEKEEAVKGTQAEFVGFEKTGENKYLKKVPNDTEIFSLGTSVKVNSKSSWQLSSDVYGNNVIASKMATLSAGDNYYYVNVIADDGTMQLYVLNIRRREIYMVTFADCDVQPQYIEEDSCATAPATANRNGYTFESWNFDFTTPIVENTVIAAKWNVVTYNIEYDLNGGINNSENPSTYTIESEDIILQTPSKTGYDFAGWYSDSRFSKRYYRIYSGSYDNLTLYAKWTPTAYSIEYDLNGGKNNSLNPSRYTVESSEIVLREASKIGYNFVGWYADETFSKKVEKIEKGTLGRKKFYAKWTPTVYNIEYGLNGGENNSLNPLTYTIESENIVLQIPSKEGYGFDGWYLDETLTKKLENITGGSYGDKKLYAKWLSIYKYSDNEITGLTDYGKELTIFNIPSQIDGNVITSIGYSAFRECTGLTSVTIDNNVMIIGRWAFYGCTGLTSVTIGDSVTNIGHYAFGACAGLISVIIGSGVTSIGDCTFYHCTGLTSMTIPDSVTSIGVEAFSGCVRLTDVIIPDSVTSIGGRAFEKCNSLKYNEYGNAFYLGNSVNNYIVLIKAKYKNITNCEIKENCKFLYDSAFSGCTGLTSVTIPDSVTSIGVSAFSSCTGLTSVTIGSGVTSIDNGSFYNCAGLTSVTILGSVTSIGALAFSGCSGLTTITIPKSVKFIDDYVFYSPKTQNLTIQYTGTKAEWKKIYKGDNLTYINTVLTVVCTDGTI